MSTNGSLKRPRDADDDQSSGGRPAVAPRIEQGGVQQSSQSVGNNGSGNTVAQGGQPMINFPQVMQGNMAFNSQQMGEMFRQTQMQMMQAQAQGRVLGNMALQMNPQIAAMQQGMQGAANAEYAAQGAQKAGGKSATKVEQPTPGGQQADADKSSSKVGQSKGVKSETKSIGTGRPMQSNVQYTHVQNSAPPSAPADANRQNTLKVEDALSYLDKVRVKFEKQPRVYNDFLDIMKEFKSSNIDTPGVIERVSELFKGHSSLIKGFNTFLPAGYKIEITDDERIMVHITNQDGVPQQAHQQQHPPQHQMPPQQVQHAQHPQQMAMAPPRQQMHMQQPHAMPGNRMVGQPRMRTGQMHPNFQAVQPKAAMPQQYQQMPPNQPANHKTPMEFDHAINYVNKIKKRFQNDTHVYKEFLDILHTYQKEQRDIEVVYKQVALLFRDQQDLLEEFSQFLPEANHHHMAAKQSAQEQRQFESTKKRGSTKNKQSHDMKIATAKKTPREKDLSQGQLEELAYFDKVKKALKNPRVYDQFLRCLNLYSHEIINKTELVDLVSNFLTNHKPLLDWFKKFVGVKDRAATEQAKQVIEAQPELDLRMCEPQDKSYRALPETHRHRLCTGRKDLDPAIVAVLNDKWVSFPTWSEEASFQATKKNHHEEAIFRCEDERFELDIIIEANLATIRNLDMVVKTLEEMTPEQKAVYKFNTKTLGGVSEVIHRKAVQRLYGERTEEVFLAMQRDPLNNIPIVLRRLKQKNLEWRNTQRQWNAIWREHNEKNYLRSLDYQAANFKRTDPLAFKAKALRETMQDMREKYREYVWKKKQGTEPEGPEPKPPVLSFAYPDRSILEPLNRLVMYVARRGNPNASELSEIEIVLSAFTPMLLGLPAAAPCSSENFLPSDKGKSGNVEEPKAENDEEKPKDEANKADDMEVEKDDTNKEETPTEKDMATETVKATGLTEPDETATSTEQPCFYANRHWFVYIKLYQILYERLLEIKNISDKIAKKHAARVASGAGPSPAVTLSLKNPLEYSEDGYFNAFLDVTEKFVNGDIDAAVFEETSREMFSTSAYKVFTMDRLLNAIQKKLQQCITEPLSRSLAGLYLRSREGKPGFNYKKEAYDWLGVGSDRMNIYKIEHKGNQQLDMELLDFELMPEEDENEPVENEGPNIEEQWQDYVQKYVKMSSTDERIQALSKNPVFLNRNKLSVNKALENVDLVNDLKCKICVNTYKMYYVTGSEDVLHRRKDANADDIETNGNRIGKLKTFLESWARDHVSSEDASACDQWMNGPDKCIKISEESTSSDKPATMDTSA